MRQIELRRRNSWATVKRHVAPHRTWFEKGRHSWHGVPWHQICPLFVLAAALICAYLGGTAFSLSQDTFRQGDDAAQGHPPLPVHSPGAPRAPRAPPMLSDRQLARGRAPSLGRAPPIPPTPPDDDDDEILCDCGWTKVPGQACADTKGKPNFACWGDCCGDASS